MAVKEQELSGTSKAEATLKEGWRMVRFGDVARHMKVDADPETSGLERYVAGEHMNTDDLHIRSWGTIGDGYLGPAFRRKFVRGQVLYGSRRTYLRKVAVAEFDGICANTTFVIEPSGDELLPDLLPFIMQTESFSAHAVKQSRGSVNPYVNWKDIAWYEFPLPPKTEQHRIAVILRAAEQNYTNRSNVIVTLSHVRQGLINKLLSDLNADNTVVLQDVCEMQNGRPFPSSDYTSEGVKLLRPGNLGVDGYLDWSEGATRFLPNDYLRTASEFLVNDGDVVINLTAQSLEDGFMGRVCIARDGDTSLLNQRIGRFKCDPAIRPEFIFRCLQTSRFRKLVEASCEGSKIKHLYWRHIEKFEIPLLSDEEQVQVMKATALVDRALRDAEKSFADSRQLYRALREKLLKQREV